MKLQITATNPEPVSSTRIANEAFLTTQELMKLLRVKHPKTIYELVKDGMPAIFVGKNYRFVKREVLDFLKTRSQLRLRK